MIWYHVQIKFIYCRKILNHVDVISEDAHPRQLYINTLACGPELKRLSTLALIWYDDHIIIEGNTVFRQYSAVVIDFLCVSSPSQEELEAITMNPTRTMFEMDWLQQHVRSVCGGQLPPLVGPYSIPFLVKQLEGMRNHFIDGFSG